MLKTKEVGSEEFLEWASWTSEAPETLAWYELERPCNCVPRCMDNLQSHTVKTTPVDTRGAMASSPSSLGPSIAARGHFLVRPKAHRPLMRFSLPPLWAALAGPHGSLGLHN